MNDFFSKLENFLFDILGLILPGAIFLLILLSPLLFMNSGLPTGIANTSVILSALKTMSGILKSYWVEYPRSVLTIAVILAYLMGHTVKVFSRIMYESLTAIFDGWLNKGFIRLFENAKARLRLGRRQSGTYLQLKGLFQPVKTIIANVFVFGAPDFYQRDEPLIQNCLGLIDSRLSITFPSGEHSMSKLSGVITNQENIKSLGTFFLAKYNLYRSLSLIFLFTTLYYLYIFRVAGIYITPAFHGISSIILAGPAVLWFTFHVKYKRYWTLYGDERLMSLFYYLNKKKLNEG